jgi:hypothetical protein
MTPCGASIPVAVVPLKASPAVGVAIHSPHIAQQEDPTAIEHTARVPPETSPGRRI